MTAVFTVIVCLGAVAGAVAGFFKKFTRTSFWGVAALLTLLMVAAIGAAVKKGDSYGMVIIIVAVVSLIVLSIIFLALQKLLGKASEARRTLSHYKNYDDAEENEELILNAVDNGDRGQYRKLMRKRRRIRDTAGIWGVLDRVFGAASCCINVALGLIVIIVCLLLFVDLSQIGVLTNAFAKPLASGIWRGIGTKLALDLPLICLLSVALHVGYRSGISSFICFTVVVGLLVGFGFASWSIASGDACVSTVNGIKSGWLAQFSDVLGETATNTVATAELAGVFFLFSLVIVIIVGMLLPRVADRLRDSKAFFAIDGVIGAVALCAVIVTVMIAMGGLAGALSKYEFMGRMNNFASYSHLGDALYTYNPMSEAWANIVTAFFGNPQ